MDVTTYMVTATCLADDLKRAFVGLRWGGMHIVGQPTQQEIEGETIHVQKYMFDSEQERGTFLRRARAAIDDPDIVYFELTTGKRWVPNKPVKAE